MIFTLILAGLVIFIVYWYLAEPKNLPPGPKGLPIVGYLPWLIIYGKNRVKLLEDLSKKYGDIYSIRTGSSYMIVLNSLELIKESNKEYANYFSNRGLAIIRQEITGGKGILSAQGHFQREHRRFILKTLRNQGFGKMDFQEPIMESIHKMQADVIKFYENASSSDQPIDMRRCLIEAVAHNISRIVLGLKFNQEELSFLISRLELIADVPPFIFLLNSFPIILTLMKFYSIRKFVGIETFKKVRLPFEARILKYIIEHKAHFDPDSITDFIYAYLEEQKNHKSSKEEEFQWDDEQIKHASTELMAAGVGTTDATITWGLMLLAKYPEWQEKIHEEIKSNIGLERDPSVRDLVNLPLSDATVLEVLRWSMIAEAGIPHATSEDVTFRGYFIPKDSAVINNLFSVSRNPKVWKDPQNFNPEANFLSDDKTHVINRDNVIPFGIGRRSCIGESLARMEIILFLLSFVQKFQMKLSPQHGFPKIAQGVFRFPMHRMIIFKQR